MNRTNSCKRYFWTVEKDVIFKQIKMRYWLLYLPPLVLILAWLSTVIYVNHTSTSKGLINHCCSSPCQNGGVCMTRGKSFECDCTGLGYYGQYCEIPTFYQKILDKLRPSSETLHWLLTGFRPIWAIVNRITPIHNFIMKHIYITRGELVDSPPRFTSAHSYITLDSYYNHSYYARTLPPLPSNCPQRRYYPPVDLLIEKFFARKEFKPEPFGTNILFAFYAQHFTHQFFKTDLSKGPGFTSGSEGVDASHIYGDDLATQLELRSMKDGKLKTSQFDGEEFPPLLQNASGVKMLYPQHVPENQRFALGHPFYALLPGLFMYATIWMREHNRVCDVLKGVHPEWDDEQLFQTARLIITGEIIKITIEDYVQHLSQYKLKLTFNPELTHGEAFQYSNRIRVEFNHLYHWHPFMPDEIQINQTKYQLKDWIYNLRPVFEHGIDNFIDGLARTRAGALTYHNHPHLLLHVLKEAIEHGRTLGLPSINEYRKRFHMEPYKNFYQMIGDHQLAEQLQNLYGSIENVEFYPGLFLEKPGSSVTTSSIVNIGGPYSVKGLMANPIASPGWWKPSTFGGIEGIKIIQDANLRTLICANIRTKCKGIHVSFSVPEIPSIYDSWKTEE